MCLFQVSEVSVSLWVLLNPEPHEGNISQKPWLKMWSWLPDMERDILSLQRRADILLWIWWGRVFMEHLMDITGKLGMGVRLYACEVKEGKNRGAAVIRIPQLAHVTL